MQALASSMRLWFESYGSATVLSNFFTRPSVCISPWMQQLLWLWPIPDLYLGFTTCDSLWKWPLTWRPFDHGPSHVFDTSQEVLWRRRLILLQGDIALELWRCLISRTRLRHRIILCLKMVFPRLYIHTKSLQVWLSTWHVNSIGIGWKLINCSVVNVFDRTKLYALLLLHRLMRWLRNTAASVFFIRRYTIWDPSFALIMCFGIEKK